jgi:hypothetical protein
MSDSDSVNILCTIPAKNGIRVPISLSKDATPTQLRQKASQATSIPISALRVIFRGRMIKDDDAAKVIDEYKLETDCVLHCIGTPVESSGAAAASTTTTTAAATATAAPSSFPSVAAAASAPAPAAAAVDPMQAALQTLRSSNPPATYTTAVTTLEKILGNIANNPLEDKYRKVKLGNAAFQKRLGGLPGGDPAMKAVGFLVETDADGAEVYQLQASPEAWPKLMASKATIEAAVQEAKRASSATPAHIMPPGLANAMNNMNNNNNNNMPPMDPAMMQNAMAGMDPAAMRNTMAGMMSNPEALRNMLQVSTTKNICVRHTHTHTHTHKKREMSGGSYSGGPNSLVTSVSARPPKKPRRLILFVFVCVFEPHSTYNYYTI